MKTAGTLCVIAIALILSGCTGQPPAPSGTGSASPLSSSTASASALPSPAPAGEGSFPKGSAVCNDSLTDSNTLNIDTATLSSDGQNLSVLITLDSPNPVHQGRAVRVVMGAVQQQEDYVAAIEETSAGVVTTSVTDSRSGSTIQVPAAASITDQKVNVEIPAADFPRLGGPFTWKVEALSSGQGVDICPNESASGVRTWVGFPKD